MDILKFALLMGLVGFFGSFLPIDFSWIFIGVIIASVINGAISVEGEEDKNKIN